MRQQRAVGKATRPETKAWSAGICVGLGLLLLELFLIATPGLAGILDASWTAPTTNSDGSPLQDLAAYRVYYGTPSSPCPGASRTQIGSPTSSPAPNQTVSLRLTGLTVGTRYYVAVTAVDTAGNESACSSVASAVARPDFAVSPTGTVAFGDVNLGTFTERTFTVTNTGGGTVSGAVSVASPFTIPSGSPFSLSGAGASKTVTVRFTPTTTATVSATVSFTAAGGTIAPIVTGRGVAGADTTRPTVTITSPTSSPTYIATGSSLTLQGTASDNIGVTGITWANSLGGSGTATGTSPWTASVTGLQIGTNVLTVTARDAAGNTATASLTVTRSSTTSTTGAETVTVDFDNPAPPGSSFSMLTGVFGGIDWGTDQWRWENPWGVDPTRHVVFATQTAGSGTFSFSPASRQLVSLRVSSPVAGTLTLTDDAGQSKTQAIPAGQLVTVTTAWTRPSTTVRVAFSAGWDLCVTSVTHAASGADTTRPTVAITTPTSSPTYIATGSSLTLQGTASDNIGVTGITWANSLGGSGTATGTSPWTASVTGLQIGTNVLTVTARDAAGNTATASLTVTRSSTTSTTGAETVTVDFDNPAPPGSSFSMLTGVFGGIDWGTDQWRWENPWGVDPTRHVFFAAQTASSATFRFSPASRQLVSLRVSSPVAGTLTLTDDAGQSKTQAIPAGQLVTVTTAWTRPSTTVRVAFSAGWDLCVTSVTHAASP